MADFLALVFGATVALVIGAVIGVALGAIVWAALVIFCTASAVRVFLRVVRDGR